MFPVAKRLRQLRCARFAVPILLPLLMLASVPAGNAQTLTFDDALTSALQQAPELRAGTALIAAARHATVPAGELPDPKLVLGLDNVPVEGDDRFSTGEDFMTMQRVGLMQEFTSGAKRKARSELATAQVDLMRSDKRQQRQIVLLETALAWIARHTWERQLALVAQWERDNALFDSVVRAQLAAATGSALDALRPREEAADIAALRDEVAAGCAQSIAQLRRWIGDAAELPLGGEAPNWRIDVTELQHNLHQHPELMNFTSRARVLDADIAESRAAKQPDWEVTLAWLERGSGYDDMAMLEVRMDLPLFTASRQTPMVASKVAQRAALDAEREASLREHAAMLEVEFSEYQRLQQSQQRFTDILLPLADEKVALALASWRSGEGALVDVIGARRERIATHIKAIAATGELQQVAARLHFANSESYEAAANTTDSADNLTGELP